MVVQKICQKFSSILSFSAFSQIMIYTVLCEIAFALPILRGQSSAVDALASFSQTLISFMNKFLSVPNSTSISRADASTHCFAPSILLLSGTPLPCHKTWNFYSLTNSCSHLVTQISQSISDKAHCPQTCFTSLQKRAVAVSKSVSLTEKMKTLPKSHVD